MVYEIKANLTPHMVSKENQKLEKPRTMVAAGFPQYEQEYLNYLRDLGYVIECWENTKRLNEHILADIPDVLLLDIDVTGEEAITLTNKLKENPLTYTMPIVIIIGNRDLSREIRSLEAGAEDYVVKPFPPQILAARIHTSVRRNIRLQVSNPLTGLPGAIYIEEQTTKRLKSEDPFAMCYVDLDYFKAFNDHYGYSRGDNVIRILATILNESISIYGKKGDFVGHIGGDDFVLINDYDRIHPICNYVTQSFDALIPLQYDEEDMEKGYIDSENRQGETQRFPLMTVSIGVVSNQSRKIQNYLVMTELATEMKEFSKTISKNSAERKSIYRIDQRQD